MDSYFERLVIRSATIDELLSDRFEVLPGQKTDSELATYRLGAWCRAAASGDWGLFERRLKRDKLNLSDVLAKFASVRLSSTAAAPWWLADAIWIDAALRRPLADRKHLSNAQPFGGLFVSVVEDAETSLWRELGTHVAEKFTATGRASLGQGLLDQLCELAAPALYEKFVLFRGCNAEISSDGSTEKLDAFISEMQNGGFRTLFYEKPVLLRLIAAAVYNWRKATQSLARRLDTDLLLLRSSLLTTAGACRVTEVRSGLSDPHNGGRSVQILSFEDGKKVVYKPKDLSIDALLSALIQVLNAEGAPVELKTATTLAREGYGWTEYIEHSPCIQATEFGSFFERAGAWLAIFHCLAGADMHHENIIACGNHPIPVDLEMIFQGTNDQARETEELACEMAMEKIANSVSTVGIVKAFGAFTRNLLKYGVADRSVLSKQKWLDVNFDHMRPQRSRDAPVISHIPYCDSEVASLLDHLDAFVSGFQRYASFIHHWNESKKNQILVQKFRGLPVRRVFFPTKFYYGLIDRLKNHQTMQDGVVWSAQVDFLARLADWEKDFDSLWPLQERQRIALIGLDIPYFWSLSDSSTVKDCLGEVLRLSEISGFDRALARLRSCDSEEVAWQIEVIKQDTSLISESSRATGIGSRLLPDSSASNEAIENLAAEVGRIVDEISSLAIRANGCASWIGIDRLRHSEVLQLLPLSTHMYGGAVGIALFLSAHSMVTNCGRSGELALEGIASIRRKLRSRNAPRMARILRTGGIAGLGSVIYALMHISRFLRRPEILEEAVAAAELFGEDLIEGDQELTLIDGNAGAILSLLRLFRETRSDDILARAVKCGEKLLRVERIGQPGRRSWPPRLGGSVALNGMSHGAAGFSFALASLASVTRDEMFATAALECISCENSTFDGKRMNWPDFAGPTPSWPSQWCHGAAGIGLSRIGIAKLQIFDSASLLIDIENAAEGSERCWPNTLDTLCCGTLGSIEFFHEFGVFTDRPNYVDLATRRLMSVVKSALEAGDYRWNSGQRRFNIGLFRGLSGVGYTILRRLNPTLPNVLLLQ